MSTIEWTDETWNPVTGCTRASPGCDHCYAVTMTRRLEAMGQEKYAGLVNPGKGHFNGVVRTHPDELDRPLRWKRPRHVFVNSMSDLFHKDVPFEFVDRVFAVMALARDHTFQVLTKRPDRMAAYFAGAEPAENDPDPTPRDRRFAVADALSERVGLDHPCRGHVVDDLEDGTNWPLPNVWLGTSTEDQPAADERVSDLLRCPAAVRFLSCEPLLGPVSLRRWLYSVEDVDPDPYRTTLDEVPYNQGLDWVIVGGESGPSARPCELALVRALVEECSAAGVAVFVKQLGDRPVWSDSAEDMAYCHRPDRAPKGKAPAQWPADLRVRQLPEAAEPA